MFNKKNLPIYILSIGVIFIVSKFSNRIKQTFETDDTQELIQEYLLNESPLYGYNRPKIWIHSKYEINARKWKGFHSRNTTDLNQEYLHLTIKTIINHCGEDFNVCLIDDESFHKLIPNWDINLSTVAEPMKSQIRNLGMMQILYIYGGMVVPNSLICTKNMKSYYDEMTKYNKPFVCEKINNYCNNEKVNKNNFIAGIELMGANKNDPVIFELVEYLKNINKVDHFAQELHFKGVLNHKCQELIENDKMNLMGGEMIGIKTNTGKPILLEDLCEEAYIDISSRAFGVYIPSEEVLKRTKYSWLASINSKELLNSNLILAKYLKASINDTNNEYYKQTKKSVVSI